MCSIKSSTQKHVKNSTPFFPVYHLHTSEIITISNFAALMGITESPNIDGGKIDG